MMGLGMVGDVLGGIFVQGKFRAVTGHASGIVDREGNICYCFCCLDVSWEFDLMLRKQRLSYLCKVWFFFFSREDARPFPFLSPSYEPQRFPT